MDILVLHPGALGDIILSLPALAILRRSFPGARIALAANLDFARAVAGGYVDDLLSFSTVPLHGLFGSGPVPEADRHFWSAFGRILSWTGAGDPQFVQNLTALSPAVLIAPWKPEAGEARHVSRIFLDSIRPWVGEQPEIQVADIFVSPVGQQRARTYLEEHGWKPDRPLFAIHPGAGSAAKRWPIENFRRIARRVLESGEQLLIVEGPAEQGIAGDVTEDDSAIVARNLDLNVLAGALQCATGFAGNDSGISHLAAALGIPTSVWFGPTSPHQWAPLGRHVELMK